MRFQPLMLISAIAVADRRLVPVDALCNRTVNWNDYTAGSTFTTANVAGGVTMSLSPAVFSGGSDPLGDNHIVQSGPTGGIPGKALTFAQTPITGAGQDITFTFSSPVENLSFIITDIDNGLQGDGSFKGSGFSDTVVVSIPLTYTSTVPFGSTVTGAGTSALPFINSNSASYGTTSPGGNLQISMAGPITTFTLKYLCGSIQQGFTQRIHMSNIKFDGACPTESPTRTPTARPTQSPTTTKPTSPPITASPSTSPTTSTPTTSRPTQSPTTSKPTDTPTTSKPTESPTARLT
jgi:hypothetical protein